MKKERQEHGTNWKTSILTQKNKTSSNQHSPIRSDLHRMWSDLAFNTVTNFFAELVSVSLDFTLSCGSIDAPITNRENCWSCKQVSSWLHFDANAFFYHRKSFRTLPGPGFRGHICLLKGLYTLWELPKFNQNKLSQNLEWFPAQFLIDISSRALN